MTNGRFVFPVAEIKKYNNFMPLKSDQSRHRHSCITQLSRARYRFASFDPNNLLLHKAICLLAQRLAVKRLNNCSENTIFEK